MKITPNLTFETNAREAFEVYARILGADRLVLFTFGEIPDSPVDAEWKDKIAHAWLEVGDQAIMGSDSPPPGACGDGTSAGTASGSIALHFDTVDEARRVFDALAEGGIVQMPFAATFWSPGFGATRDRFGKDWLINTRQETAP
ncbi:VOC family protein [Pseudochelatococcus sp. B33]